MAHSEYNIKIAHRILFFWEENSFSHDIVKKMPTLKLKSCNI